MEVLVKKFLISIGIDGVEAILNLDEYKENSKQVMIEKLSDPSPEKGKYVPKINKVLTSLHLRFRMNSHRKIKSYLINLPVESEDEVWRLCENNHFLKLVKQKGEKFDL